MPSLAFYAIYPLITQPKHIQSMHKRLSLVFLPLLYAPVSLASESAWNCEQSKETKEWRCLGDEKPATRTDDTTTSEPSFIPTKKPQAIPARPYIAEEDSDEQPMRRPETTAAPIERPAPVITPPVQAFKPESLPPVEAVTTEPEPVAPTAKTEPSPAPTFVEDTTPARKVADAPSLITDSPALDSSVKEEESETEIAEEDDKTPNPAKTASSSSLKHKIQGWNCDSKEEAENWNCQLVGADPKGRAQPVKAIADNSYSFSLLDPAFDQDQEQNFGTLVSRMKQDPWENCATPQTPAKAPATSTEKKVRDNAPLELTSDAAEIFDNEIGHYLGNVEIKRADQQSLSHVANYDKISETLDLSGDVYYNEDNLALYGRSASLKLGTDQSKLRDALFVSPAGHLRGSSKVVYRDSKTLSRYKDVSYTSCPPNNHDWVLHASELKINDNEKRGAAKNAWIEFKGVPVFYSPYLSFPTDKTRKTGLLMPSFHFTRFAGVGFNAPFYWNIAPNYDLLFTPRYLQRRGLLLGANFRYMTDMTKGFVKAEYMPNDSELKKSRYLASVTNSTTYLPGLTSSLDANYVSDKNYFAQLGNALSIPNFSFLRSFASVNYARPGVTVAASVDNYQSVDPNIITLPYRRLPQINLTLFHNFKTPIPVNVAVENESVFFQNKTLINAHRLNTKPSISIPWQTASAFITPKLALQYTHYSFSNQTGNALSTSLLTPGAVIDTTTIGGIANSSSRTLPIASLDSGVFFEKELQLGSSSMLHTIEPRLFYLYIPHKNQSNIPVFDSAAYDFTFPSLFRENRFSGADRIQSANQITTAVTSRLIDSATGRENLKLNIGSIFYLQDKNIDPNSILPFAAINNRWISPLITEVSSQLSDHVSVDTGMQWDPQVNTISRGTAAFHYIDNAKIFNAGYTYRRDTQVANQLADIKQTDVSVHWPIYDNWSVIGRWQYSWLYNKTQEGFLGIEKENCCWRFQIVGRRFLNSFVGTPDFINTAVNSSIATGQAQTTVFFQVELKGLGAIGENLDNFLERNIYGYRSPAK